ncbi:hypothetical protein BX070DRAFT_217449 [Coemansia spiralis]|nr:hypothetical protein BX070DRAFT_217449 [Coemansia spiralis]
MVNGPFTIEPSTRLHHQEALGSTSDLALVDGWYQNNTQANKRTLSDDTPSKRARVGLRIDDLLNPLAAAHKMTVPTVLVRSRSEDSKHYYNQIMQLQLRLQQTSSDANPRMARTSTAPTESADACAQGLVREALELDKLYGKCRLSFFFG